ncbi:MAG: aminotransferase class I/II-fold pyridoxal phosphate-dependent enzyme [Candidatus Gastranaerophilales bacterium]|nr:aminotransferase class I/II-fold pyridoxal phosphate-dependent enzyme [Candidatus Gastranaerophilales bacterium]
MSFKELFRKNNNKTLFTTPSHSQKFCILHKFRQFYKYDISETDAHNPELALLAAQDRATKIYGTKQTLFLTNGSSSGIITAVLATCSKTDKVLIWKNAHRCHKNAVELAGATPLFYDIPQNTEWGIPDKISNDVIEKHLKEQDIKAVIITSPSYEGIVSDIKTLKDICKKYNTYLIVDEAHGALYPFSDELPETAIKYADIVVQSLHKTAGGLNPTALIHSNIDIDLIPALEKITTTSPSYPLLASIEANINYLHSTKGKRKLQILINDLKNLRNICPNIDFYGDDITKILIKKTGLTGEELSEMFFEKYSIEDEKTNNISTMLLCGIGTTSSKLKKLANILSKL